MILTNKISEKSEKLYDKVIPEEIIYDEDKY